MAWLRFLFVGQRPNHIEGLPKPIEMLMVQCWDPSPTNRPSMEEVHERMKVLCLFFPHAEPLNMDDEFEDEVVSLQLFILLSNIFHVINICRLTLAWILMISTQSTGPLMQQNALKSKSMQRQTQLATQLTRSWNVLVHLAGLAAIQMAIQRLFLLQSMIHRQFEENKTFLQV